MGKKWTIENIPDLSGKVIIVTGANNGLGFEAAKAFALHGANTILACRNREKAEAALRVIKAEIPNSNHSFMHLDLASLASVQAFAASFKETYQRLDVLVNNAGILAVPYARTADGFESQFGTNHLGHFALTGLLIDILLETRGSRVVTVSSISHRGGAIDFDNLNYAEGVGYSRMGAYRRSKLANLLFAYELERRLEAVNANTISVAAHPGISITNIVHHYDHLSLTKVLRFLFEWVVPSASVGVLPILRAAVDLNVKGGEYYGPGGYFRNRRYPKVVQSSQRAHRISDAEELWQVSEELTGVCYL